MSSACGNLKNNNKMKKVKQILTWCLQKARTFCHWYRNLYRGRKWYAKTLIGIASCIVAFFLYLGAVDINLLWLFGKSPGFIAIKDAVTSEASEIYSDDGVLIGKYFNENRTPVKFEDVNPAFWKALIATEDERFYSHHGIDYKGLASAVKDAVVHHDARGASTITQQLAKQLYSEKASSTLERLLQKPIEWVIAIKLERYYTKQEILALYLNYFDFLHNAVGIKTAANTYFNKEPKDLTLTEAATLIGLCKNPSLFNPVRYPERARDRRNVVLSQMVKAGYLDHAEYSQYSAEPLTLNFHRTDHKDGSATYLREYLRKYLMATRPEKKDYASWNYAQFVTDSILWNTDPLYGWCNKNFKKDGSPYNVYSDGLKVFTTVDSRMQRYAEEAVYQHVARYLQPAFSKEISSKPSSPYSDKLTPKQIKAILNRSVTQCERYRQMKEAGCSAEEIHDTFRKKIPMTVFTYHGDIDTLMSPLDSIRYYKTFLRSGFMSMDPKTGAVKAYVGGLDYTHFMYDMVSLGRRQVGSTIKPFLYSLAMENGFSPCDLAPNRQQTYMVAGRPWTPRNANHSRYGQMVPLSWGLAQSNNWISAYLMSKLNPSQFVQLLHDYGVNNPDIHASLSLCLGPCEVSVSEMVSAYTAFANHGIRTAPMFVSRIEDNEGNTIATFQPRMNEVISADNAMKMLTMMMGVVDNGTAGRLRYRYKLEGQIGAKTGTTNNNSDGWFIAFTPQLVSGCWVGGEDRDIHFDSMSMGQGATMALPIWAIFMKKVYADVSLGYSPEVKFDIPADYNPCYHVGSGGEQDSFEQVNAIDEVFE